MAFKRLYSESVSTHLIGEHHVTSNVTRAKQLLAIAIVSTLLFGGIAALGAASPADQTVEYEGE